LRKWDTWALTAIIGEADMERDAYLKVKNEIDAKEMFTQHMKNKKTCKHLSTLLKKIILGKREDEEVSLAEMKEIVKKIRF